MDNHKIPLLGHTLDELKAIAVDNGLPTFAGKQMAVWLYDKHVDTIEEMTNISKANREKLTQHYEIGAAKFIDAQYSKDGTIKYLFPTESGKFVETVFMGQGEPMDNLDNVLKVTQILTADYGYAWSPKRITVSSVGVKGKLKRFLDESDCHVAISMHTPIPEQRASIMPAEKGLSIEEIVQLLKQYDFTHQRRLSFEYIMFGGLNDTPLHARQLVKLVEGLDCRVNLIRFHQIPNVTLNNQTRNAWKRSGIILPTMVCSLPLGLAEDKTYSPLADFSAPPNRLQVERTATKTNQ